jgi:hypothetical protein
MKHALETTVFLLPGVLALFPPSAAGTGLVLVVLYGVSRMKLLLPIT